MGMADLNKKVFDFNKKIINLPFPDPPQKLEGPRLDWALTALTEEITELAAAESLADQADALIDLTYFALGRVAEMGLLPGVLFDEVHEANMKKVRGEVSKRPNSLGNDAIKPEGWTPPNLEPLLDLRKEDIPGFQKKPKVVICGYAGHGKDTAAQLMSLMGYRFKSTSWTFCEEIIFPKLKEKYNYKTVLACFTDRTNHRAEWYDLITEFNTPDKTASAKMIFAKNDIYCGMRNIAELEACRENNVVDCVIWVNNRKGKVEDESSNTITNKDCDYILHNSSSVQNCIKRLKTIITLMEVRHEYSD